MNNAAIQAVGEGRFLLTGDLDFNDVPQLLSASMSMFADKGAHLVVDLSGVGRTTSVGLALMWNGCAARAKPTRVSSLIMFRRRC